MDEPTTDDSDVLAERVGPCFRASQVGRLLPGLRGRLISLRTRGRLWFYPA